MEGESNISEPQVSDTKPSLSDAARIPRRSIRLGSVSISLVIHHLTLVLSIISGAILAIAAWSGLMFWMGDTSEGAALAAFGLAGMIGLAASGITWLRTRWHHDHFGRREALLLVSMSWLFGAGMAAIPFFLWAHLAGASASDHPFFHPVDCYFEAISGLTTTGASILPDIESLPRSLVLWRSTTHWMGGLGIILLFAALLPSLGLIAKKLVRAETSSTFSDGDGPTMRQLARSLWLIYTGITLAGVIGLRLAGGMSWFDAVNHSFAALATGGFSTRNANTGAFSDLGALGVLITLMILGSVNFRLYYHVVQRRYRAVFKDRELQLYLVLLFVASTVTIASLVNKPIVLTNGQDLEPSVLHSITHGVFNVVSMHTDTGFATADFDQWPGIALAVICFGTFVGGSMGSTTGGIKVVRLLLIAKIIIAHVRDYLPSKRVRTLKLGHRTIDERTQERVLIHVVLFTFVLIAGAMGLMLLESQQGINAKTAGTAALATLCTAGPGLGRVGPVHNYLWFTASSKVLMSFLMILGRLELFTFLAILTPGFWRSE